MDRKMLDARFQLKALTQEGSFEGYGAVFDAEDRQGDPGGVVPAMMTTTLLKFSSQALLKSLQL